jgi:glycosyltransferase involved in cell wall biosynthesis
MECALGSELLSINARFRLGPQTGVQRVAAEILTRLDMARHEIMPTREATGIKGHAWEQCVLPLRARGAPLWSPCNTGPLAVRSHVVTIHDAAIFDHPEWFSRKFVGTYRFLLPRLARSARRIVTVSRFSRARLAAALNIVEDRIEIVPNGVSEHFRPPAASEIARVAQKYCVDPGRYFATLSTLEPRKNLGSTLRAWEKARERLPKDTRLVLIGGAGKGGIFADEAVSRPADSVLRAGFVPDDDLPALLGGALGLLYPSLYEGFGLPILEAMACGTPVVTADSSSLPEVGGAAALYVEAGDTAAIADVICLLAGNEGLRTELREAGMAQARLFSWDDSAAQMRHILKRDLGL